jgi:hypothetical protein
MDAEDYICRFTTWIPVGLAQGEGMSHGMEELSHFGICSFLPECRGCPPRAGIRHGPSKPKATTLIRGTSRIVSSPAGT